jgi:lysozyme family protein
VVLTDFAVNAGVAVAVRRLQQLVGVKVDGIFGQKTFDATAAVTDIEIWIIRYTAARHAYYQSLVDNNPNMRFFLKGWLRRAVEALECALSKQP